ncbi:hypothetical protein [Flagellimonas aurea]|uniref:hypothetical protein n=1 Tax=Flagellimonas aurea TaxID=2915619 RepID=UPI0035CF9A6B
MKRILLILLLIVMVGCSAKIKEQRFDKNTWNDMDDIFYSNREAMVNDLIENYLYEGMSYSKLEELLGPHNNYANIGQWTIGYEIMVDYAWDIDPVKGKTLYFKLDKDSTIINYELEYWEH